MAFVGDRLFNPISRHKGRSGRVVRHDHGSRRGDRGTRRKVRTLRLVAIAIRIRRQGRTVDRVGSHFFRLFRVTVPSLRLAGNDHRTFQVDTKVGFCVPRVAIVPRPVFAAPLTRAFREYGGLGARIKVFECVFGRASCHVNLS